MSAAAVCDAFFICSATPERMVTRLFTLLLTVGILSIRSTHLHCPVLLPAVHSLLADQCAVRRLVVRWLRHSVAWRPQGALLVWPQSLGTHEGLLPHQGEETAFRNLLSMTCILIIICIFNIHISGIKVRWDLDIRTSRSAGSFNLISDLQLHTGSGPYLCPGSKQTTDGRRHCVPYSQALYMHT